MSDIWPPPPDNQPQTVMPATSPRRSLASFVSSGLFYSCVGTLMLLSLGLVAAGRNFFLMRFFANADLFLGKLALFGFIIVIVGGSLGYRYRRTTNGLTALIISFVALCLQCGLVLRGFF